MKLISFITDTSLWPFGASSVRTSFGLFRSLTGVVASWTNRLSHLRRWYANGRSYASLSFWLSRLSTSVGACLTGNGVATHTIRKPWASPMEPRITRGTPADQLSLITLGDERMFSSYELNGLVRRPSYVPVFPNVWGNRRYPGLVGGASPPHLLN
jgi:hypothetical protein